MPDTPPPPVGSQVRCTDPQLEIHDQPGVVEKTGILGVDESVVVRLDRGDQVAFFGDEALEGVVPRNG